MKIDFNIRCENSGVVWAVKAALERAGFRVHDCGVKALRDYEADL